jgi:hypothetical protein
MSKSFQDNPTLIFHSVSITCQLREKLLRCFKANLVCELRDREAGRDGRTAEQR